MLVVAALGGNALLKRGELLTAEAQRLACGLLLVSPCVPLVWMGEEYGETRPFPFFSSFGDPQLVEAVRRGRREEFAALEFRWGTEIPDPQSPETFLAAKLQWDWSSPETAGRRRLYADLLAARRDWPALRDRRHTVARVKSVARCGDACRLAAAGTAVPQSTQADVPSAAKRQDVVLILERGAAPGIVACANLSAEPVILSDVPGDHELLLSTEWNRYGGRRDADRPLDELLPYEMLLFGPKGQLP